MKKLLLKYWWVQVVVLTVFEILSIGVYMTSCVFWANLVSILCIVIFLTIIISWLLSFIFSMLPYVLYGGEFTLINACFESVSGYTTTGSTILNDIEA